MLVESGLVTHAFSTRLGGCSEGPYSSLNMSYYCGDNTENVIENRRRFFSTFKYDYLNTVSAEQVHGTGLCVAGAANCGEGALPDRLRQKCDALITEVPGLPLVAYSADCMLIYFASKQMPLAAIAHAGWRGTLGSIAAKVVCSLEDNYRADPGQIIAVLSPSICRSCYQVDETTADRFRAAGWGGPAFLEPQPRKGFKLDLAAVNHEQLLLSGIKKENLVVSSYCTSCSAELFYSYRREQGVTGRMVGFIAIND